VRQRALWQRPEDVAFWLTSLETPDVEAVAKGAVAVDAAALGFAKGLIVRDLDGHALRLEEK
jgi:hypothetical protein